MFLVRWIQFLQRKSISTFRKKNLLIPFWGGMFSGKPVGRQLPTNILTFLQSQVSLSKGHWQTWLKDDDVAKMPWKPEMLFGS